MKSRQSQARRRSPTRSWRTAIQQIKVRGVSPLIDYRPVQAALRHLVKLLGNNQTAQILGVSNSQASRWLHGEPIGAESARRVSDLDYVLSRALQVFHPDEAGAFLTFPQPFLHGARPIDVLVTRGAAPVIAALDQIAAGAFV